jgi:starch-binding outer membrane protein, SusD/RagB family
MRKIALLLGILCLGVGTGCSNWLSDPVATTNPNRPTVSTSDQLLVATETAQTQQYTSDLARTVCVWMQQCAGTDRQYRSLGLYQYGEDAYNGPFGGIYTGGGLIDLRTIEARADSANDRVYGGIARVLEAMTVGIGADIWGDIPYSEAVANTKTPKLDPQQDVYAGIQAKLDTAVTMLTAATGTGPGGADLFYGGDATKWLRLAHTLKARYFLHVAEREGTPAYESALAEAQLGLQKGDDMVSYQSADPNEQNSWYQFIVIQRSGYMSPGANLVNLLKTRNDPRLAEYFAPNSDGQYVGAAPGQQGSASISEFDPDRTGPAFRQPIVTAAENNLIIAESAFQLGQTGLALSALNAERADAGLTPVAGTTLADIMTEKYIALFQNTEVWNDWKRTCLPALTPAQGTTGGIPERLLYAQSERNTNPNVPLPSDQPVRNWNDPNGCS